MRLLHPFNLLWLLPIAGLIVAMYILKLRRQDVIVSSTFLWRQAIRDVQANAPFQKLRKNLLLLLQLLAALLLVLILAQPFWHTSGLGGRSIVLVLDVSASMLATDESGSRMDAARQRALQIIGDMKPQDQVMVIAASARPEAVTGFSSDRSVVSQAVSRLTARQTRANMRDALNLAAALVATRDAAQIDIVSDGAFEPVIGVNLGKTHVHFHPVGRRSKNVGITAVDYRRNPAGEGTIEVLIALNNFDSQPQTFTVELTHEKRLLDAREVTLPPGGENLDIFEIPEPQQPVTLTARLDADDEFAADNQASLILLPRKPIRTLLVSDGNLFLEKALQVDPNVELSSVHLAGFTSPDGFDVVIFDRAAPAKLPEGNYLFVNCGSDQSPAEPGAEAENQTLIDPDRSHPTLRYVDFAAARWTRMRRGTPAGWAQELASFEWGPAIIAGEKGRMRALWIGFGLDLNDGPFPLTVSYPIFLSNAIRWLSFSEDAAATQIRTGTTITLDTPADVQTITITKPDGTRREIAASGRGGTAFDDTDQSGIYTATGANGYRRLFAANLSSYAESNIAPRHDHDFGAPLPGEPGRQVAIQRALWPWLAAALLGLLALEWWAFHRRAFVR
jgi:Ca-activated chloride channel family protein